MSHDTEKVHYFINNATRMIRLMEAGSLQALLQAEKIAKILKRERTRFPLEWGIAKAGVRQQFPHYC